MNGTAIDFNSTQLREDVIQNSQRIITPFEDTCSWANYSLQVFTADKTGMVRITNYEPIIQFLNDSGLVSEYLGDLKFKYYVFDKKIGYYRETTLERVFAWLKGIIHDFVQNVRYTKSSFDDFVANVDCFIRRIEDLEKTDEYLELETMYNDGEVIPFKNGLYSLRYNRFLPRTSCKLIKFAHQVNFNPFAIDNEIATKYLEICDENPTLFEYLFEQIGYAMYADTFIIPTYTVMYGPGGNGKSIIIDNIRKIMDPEAVSSVSLEGMANDFTVASSAGKKMNLISDSSSGHASESSGAKVTAVPSFMKESSSGEVWEFNPKHQRPFKDYGPRKFVFATNVMLNLNDTSRGTTRRLRAVYLPREFKTDYSVEQQFKSQGAVEWFAMQALDSLKRFINNAMHGEEDTPGAILTGQYIECNEGDEVKKAMIVKSDVSADFLVNEMGIDVLGDTEAIREKLTDPMEYHYQNGDDIWRRLTLFCNETGRNRPSLCTFREYLKAHYGLDIVKSSTTWGTNEKVNYYKVKRVKE